ncbi:hypothetical protein ES705_39707 [subsurface metagenome]
MASTGTVAITEQTHKMIKKVTFDWIGTSGGLAGDTTDKYYNGEVLRIVHPESASSTGITLTVSDSDGFDLLGGQGSTMSSGDTDFGTSTGAAIPSRLSVVDSKITLSVSKGTSGGSTGQTIVYIR